MLFGGCKVTMNMAYASVPCWIREIRGHLITQEIYNEAVRIEPRSLAFVPDHFKTEEMCNKAVHRDLYPLDYVPDLFKTLEMCNKAMTTQQPFFLFLIILKHNKCVLKQLKWTHGSWGMSLITLKHKRCVMMQKERPFFSAVCP